MAKPPISAIDLAIVAQDFALAADQLLKARGDKRFQHLVSIYHLASHSLEVGLKSAYIHLGGEDRHVQNLIRHDLQLAWGGAYLVGFRPDHPNTVSVVKRLHEPHLHHLFRYLHRDDSGLPEPREVVDVAVSLASQVRNLVVGS